MTIIKNNKNEAKKFVFELILTTRCNLCCDYCYAKYLKKQDISFSLVQKLIDNYPISKLIFTGGEPLLVFPLMREIVSYIKKSKKDINFRLQTNGTLLTDNVISFIKEFDIEVDISLDGSKVSHDSHRLFQGDNSGSYGTVLDNFKRLKKNKVKFTVNYTVNPDTLEGLAENLALLVKEYTIDVGFVFTEKPILPDIADRYLKELSKFLFYYHKNHLFLEIDKIYPFETWFRSLLFGETDRLREALDVRCRYHRMRLFPTGEIYPCVASYSLIPQKYKERCCLGNVENLDTRRLFFLQKELDLSEWLADKKLKKCNRVCYLYAKDPANRFKFEKRVAKEIITLLSHFINNLSLKERQKYAFEIRKKLSLSR